MDTICISVILEKNRILIRKIRKDLSKFKSFLKLFRKEI
ncbi:hypothetical protein LEP1GSC007_1298 [Leptospira interrogans serovar Bulgarica str. Mallika]|nr:hypothetical protein LEP1GSC007_1298 [Leptospira interrogans serovar Bulgarica str. Mallika]